MVEGVNSEVWVPAFASLLVIAASSTRAEGLVDVVAAGGDVDLYSMSMCIPSTASNLSVPSFRHDGAADAQAFERNHHSSSVSLSQYARVTHPPVHGSYRRTVLS